MARIEVEIEDYLDEVETRYLVKELKRRKVLPELFEENAKALQFDGFTRTPKRFALIEFLKLHQSATLEDIQEAIKENFNK
jgi:hypothetical protein